MEVTEMNNCLSKFYLSARKQDGSHYKKTSLLSIRAALDRYLRSPPINKKFFICDTIQFNEANKALNSYLKHLASTGKIAGTVHKNPLTAEVVQKLFEAGELASAETKNPLALLQTTWFYFSLYLGKRGRQNQSLMKKSVLCLRNNWAVFLTVFRLFETLTRNQRSPFEMFIMRSFARSWDPQHSACAWGLLLGCPASPVINSVFGRLCRKTASRGREDTRVWYLETMFSQMVTYEFLLHEPLHGYFLYLVCAPPEKPTKRCEPEEGYLRCSKRFDHGSHSIIFLLFEFKSVRWCWRWETQRNAHVAYKPTRRSR